MEQQQNISQTKPTSKTLKIEISQTKPKPTSQSTDIDKLVAESELDDYWRVHLFAEELDMTISELEKKYDLTLKKNKIRVKTGTNKWEISLRKFVTSAYSIMEIERLDKIKHREVIETPKK